MTSVGLGLGLAVLLPRGEAHATCGYDCTGTLVNDDCSGVSGSDGVHDWTRTDGFHVAVTCSETCCGGGENCSTVENARPDSFAFGLRNVTEDDYLDEIDWEVEQACDGYMISGTTDLVLEHRYEFRIDSAPIATFDVVEESGCSVGGRSGRGAPLLLLLGIAGVVARRRSR